MARTWHDLPGPPARWWGLPALLAMRRDYLGAVAAQQRFGDLVRLAILNERTVDVFDPELVRELLVDHADALIRWERGTEVFAEGVGQSVLVTEGAVWQRQRQMLMPAFTAKRVAGYTDQMVAAATQGLAPLVPGETSMDDLFSHLAMDVISRTLFSAPLSGDPQAAAAAVQVFSATALREMFWPVTLPDWLPLPGKAAKRRAWRLIHTLIAAPIAARRRLGPGEPATADILDLLLSARDAASGEGLSAAEVFDQCVVSFQAGHETTATALVWWSWLVARHPEAQARAAAEIDAALEGRPPGASAVHALPWLTATLKEAMRLFPPVAAIMTRRLTRAVVLGGVHLPARTMVRVTPWLLHRDPRWWRDPDAFRPERFLPAEHGGAPDRPPRGAYIPFGLGPRVCLGQHFAQVEMTIIAAMLLQRFQLSPLSDAPPRLRQGVTVRPDGGVRLRLQTRR